MTRTETTRHQGNVNNSNSKATTTIQLRSVRRTTRTDLKCNKFDFKRQVEHEPQSRRLLERIERKVCCSKCHRESNTLVTRDTCEWQKKQVYLKSVSSCHPSRYYSNKAMACCSANRRPPDLRGMLVISSCIIILCHLELLLFTGAIQKLPTPFSLVGASLIVGDSAIEIHEVDSGMNQPTESNQQLPGGSNRNEPSVILATSLPGQTELNMVESLSMSNEQLRTNNKYRPTSGAMPGPLPPLASSGSMNTSNSPDGKVTNEADSSLRAYSPFDKAIAGKVVDFELTPAGGHNKAKIKKKKKKKKKEESEMYKKWAKKKKEEKKSSEKEHKESMKKKKEEGQKKKKKWGHTEQGLKKKGNFKKKKWGKNVKKGIGKKQGKKGKKFLKDKGHKHTGFHTVYHKEEYGNSKKWHDIKRKKEWDEEAKKWKKKWNKEKGKKYKGNHMKKFEKKKKEGKKYEKEKKDKYKKYKKEKFEKGKKKKMEEHGKKKEGGEKKKETKMKRKKKKP